MPRTEQFWKTGSVHFGSAVGNLWAAKSSKQQSHPRRENSHSRRALTPFRHWKKSANPPVRNWRIAANALDCISARAFLIGWMHKGIPLGAALASELLWPG